MLHIQDSDECCNEPFLKARNGGQITDETLEWHCPDCGCRWLPEVREGIVHWYAMPIVSVFR